MASAPPVRCPSPRNAAGSRPPGSRSGTPCHRLLPHAPPARGSGRPPRPAGGRGCHVLAAGETGARSRTGSSCTNAFQLGKGTPEAVRRGAQSSAAARRRAEPRRDAPRRCPPPPAPRAAPWPAPRFTPGFEGEGHDPKPSGYLSPRITSRGPRREAGAAPLTAPRRRRGLRRGRARAAAAGPPVPCPRRSPCPGGAGRPQRRCPLGSSCD